jgi:excisionase family DNA binding protein
MNDDILTIPEVAELLRIAEKTVYTLAQRAEIPAFKVGGQWRFSRGAIQAWIEERTRSAQQPGNGATKSMPKGRNARALAAQTRTRRSR